MPQAVANGDSNSDTAAAVASRDASSFPPGNGACFAKDSSSKHDTATSCSGRDSYQSQAKKKKTLEKTAVLLVEKAADVGPAIRALSGDCEDQVLGMDLEWKVGPKPASLPLHRLFLISNATVRT